MQSKSGIDYSLSTMKLQEHSYILHNGGRRGHCFVKDLVALSYIPLFALIPISASVGLASKILAEGSYTGTPMPEKATTCTLTLLLEIKHLLRSTTLQRGEHKHGVTRYSPRSAHVQNHTAAGLSGPSKCLLCATFHAQPQLDVPIPVSNVGYR